MNNEYDVKEVNRRLCRSLRHDLTTEEITNFALLQPLDVNFIKFVEFCKVNNIPITIVSDGYEEYIRPILSQYNLSDIAIYCNRLVKDEEGFYPAFFGAVEGCHCSTASCKRNVVLNNSEEKDIIVYIGDGYTDFCGAEHSDIVFAKSKLAAYCNEHKIPHHPYKTFFDVYRILENKIKTNNLQPRHQARMKRKLAFETE